MREQSAYRGYLNGGLLTLPKMSDVRKSGMKPDNIESALEDMRREFSQALPDASKPLRDRWGGKVPDWIDALAEEVLGQAKASSYASWMARTVR